VIGLGWYVTLIEIQVGHFLHESNPLYDTKETMLYGSLLHKTLGQQKL